MSQIQRTVLIIDDSPEDRQLYRRYLLQDRDYHYTIWEAQLGQEGLELWQRYQPDVVLLDYRLPDLDGLELLAQIPIQMPHPCLPVIMITGQGNEAIAVQAMKAGAQDYLLKEQITPDSLHLALNRTIETVRLRTQLQQRLERERLVAQITQQIYQSLELDEILQTTVTEVRQFLKTDRVLIFRLQSEGWGQVTKESVRTDCIPLLSTSLHDPCLNEHYIESFRQGLITVKPDIYDSSIDPCHVELLAQLQVRANLVVPILQDKQLWGMLIVHHCTAPRQWQSLEIDLLKELATHVGIALQQAELYQQAQSELVERRRAELALRENQVQLQQQLAEIEAIYQSAPIGLNVLDTDLRFVRINQRLAEINGLSVADHIGRTVRELLPELADTAEPFLRAILETGEPQLNVEIQGETPAQPGVQRTWLEHFLPLKNGDRTIGISTVCEEITDRKLAEEALRESQERYQCLAELIPQLVWTASAEGMLLDVNQRWSDYTGLTLAQAQICGWEAVIHPDDLPVLSQQWAVTVETGTPYQAEGRMRRADGVYRWHLHQAIPQRNERNQIIWFGTATDIEAQKQLEIERDHLLEREKAARTEAERASRLKDEFLAILSHELRSPLNPILGWTKLLQTRKFDAAKTAEALSTIERNAKLQTQLIDDLLDVARILRGKLTLNAAPMNLVFMIESAIETVQTAAVAKSISLHPVLPNIGQVSGDSVRLQQIVWNLLSNAIKFTPNGGQVMIELEQINDMAQIKVTDTGKGISSDFLPHIFESFRQEDASITRQHGGLGLGLAIVYNLVEAHGGTISAASPGLGQGATFTVRLPLLKVEPQSDRPHDSLNGELDLTGIRVVLVDDDPDTRELLAFILKEYGAEAMVVASAGEVLTLLESFKPDILVTDIGMPDMDGYTLLRQVRSLPPERGGQVPAIATTAYARMEDRQQALTAGFQKHIAKPIDPSKLVAAISDLLSQR
ncbi:response regulator [Merismopedia glauca]|uniref:Circadian input-output histidine kinase CikA n=1 Tax=Merismopedia glauca CCAP 1448/3 TaxID=1296344 RepID=A0A2T1C3H7_9CYAN|nr:response regulator [Merismopedia glauca]PSB02754.1 hypothetical protein C7B64_11760 [Merismopedia glauca CCAP 1448/3]